MISRRDAIRALYAQVAAPDWASPNLDGLVDVLRDLSWLPEGEVVLTVPDGLTADDEAVLRRVLAGVVVDTAGGPRPVVLA